MRASYPSSGIADRGEPNSGGGAAEVPVGHMVVFEVVYDVPRCPTPHTHQTHAPLGMRALRRFFVCSMLSSGLVAASRPLRRGLVVGSGGCSLMDVEGACSLET